MTNIYHDTNRAAPALLSEPEAAQFLSVTPRTLRDWRCHRGVPHIKITNKVVRYRLTDLEDWLRLREVAILAPRPYVSKAQGSATKPTTTTARRAGGAR